MFLKEPLFNQMAFFYNNNKNKLCILTKQHSARPLVGWGPPRCWPVCQIKKNKAEELYLGFVYVSAALVITKRERDAFKCLPAMWQLAQV
jgi:hypothetical protein